MSAIMTGFEVSCELLPPPFPFLTPSKKVKPGWQWGFSFNRMAARRTVLVFSRHSHGVGRLGPRNLPKQSKGLAWRYYINKAILSGLLKRYILPI